MQGHALLDLICEEPERRWKIRYRGPARLTNQDEVQAGLLRRSAGVWVCRLLAGGVVLFSGSLYAMALTGVRGLGAVTPIGGIAFLPFMALAKSASTPLLMRGPHAALSPNFGAPASPAS